VRMSSRFSSIGTTLKFETIQRRLAWPLRKDDVRISSPDHSSCCLPLMDEQEQTRALVRLAVTCEDVFSLLQHRNDTPGDLRPEGCNGVLHIYVFHTDYSIHRCTKTHLVTTKDKSTHCFSPIPPPFPPMRVLSDCSMIDLENYSERGSNS
jgi:hypothetical protein